MFLLCFAIAFVGYVLPWGQMSLWGATVITNLLSPFPAFLEWVCGGHTLNQPTLKRFFLFHFILPFIVCGFTILHLFFLHFHSSNNPARLNTNNKVPFFPFIYIKDIFGVTLIFFSFYLQNNDGFLALSHPDNATEALEFVTPHHIVPEWYFLAQYAMLKSIPNKNAGFIILLSSILSLFLFLEVRSYTTVGNKESFA